MNKSYFKKWRQSLLALLIATGGAVPWQSASADVLLKENFEYSVGDLYGQGGWIRSVTNKTNPIKLSEGGLSYAGYLSSPVGNKVELSNDATTGNESLMHFFDNDAVVGEGTVYSAMLINVKDLDDGNSYGYFFALQPQVKSPGLVDGGTQTNDFARLFIVPTADGKHYTLAACRGGAYTKAKKGTDVLDLNTTYLLVVSYTFVPGTTNDVVKVWINPQSTSAEPATANLDLSDDASTGEASTGYGGLKAVKLRQAKTGSNAFSKMSVDALHVATTWAELFEKVTPPVVEAPVIISSNATFSMGNVFVGDAVTFTTTVKGENLKGDINITLPTDVTCDRASISKAEAEAGVELEFTVTPSAESQAYQRTITLYSDGAEDIEIKVSGVVTQVTKLATAREVVEAGRLSANEAEPMLYTGKAVVTGVEKSTTAWGSSTYNIFLQDATGGLIIADAWGALKELPAVGDELTNIQFMFMEKNAKIAEMVPTQFASAMPFFEVSAKNVAVEPIVVEMADVNASTYLDYAYRLLKVEGVNFVDPAGKKFSTANSYFTKDGVQAAARAFSGSPLIGTALPEGTVSITGVSRSTGAFVLSLRDASDIEEAVAATAVITTSEASFAFGTGVVGRPLTFSTTVSGENLTDAITITCPADITCDKASVSAAEAEAGAVVTFTVTPSKADENYDKVITFSTPGADDLAFHVNGYTTVFTDIRNTTQLKAQYDDPNVDACYYTFTGKLVVTGVNQTAEGECEIFAQDMVGGIRISTTYTAEPEVSPFKVGDEITNFSFFLIGEDVNTPTIYIFKVNDAYPFFEKTAEGKTKTPVEITIDEITKVTAPEYLYRLVTVKDVTFTDAEGKQYTAVNMPFTDGTNSAVARAFRNCDLIGRDLPTGSVSLTGISYSAAQLTLLMRDSGDVISGAASLAVNNVEKLVDFNTTAAPIGEATAIMTITVAAENLPQDAPIQIYGNDEQYFYTEPAAIPAGTGTHEVKVYYKPDQVGRHKCMLFINTDAFDPVLNYTRQIDGKAYDPENMPVIVLDPAVIDMETNPGKPVTATVKMDAASCFDYINVSRSSQAGNGITINSTLLLPSQQEFVITFNPTEEGEYTETFTFTSTMCQVPATLTVNAVCKGQREPEEKQGDEFVVSSDNPLYTYVQDFESVAHNTPLKLEGWTNVAAVGTRAWWGFNETGEEPFKAAKATAYDSAIRPADGEAAEMMLISPALDYANAGTKLLEFRLMGMYLDKNQETVLEILFGEPNGTPQPDFYPMAGFEIPMDAEQAGEWIPYQVDMSVVPDMPDTFFIAFRLKSTRSQAEPATYYIDDFAWNRAGTVSVDTVLRDGSYDVFNLQGIRILSGADAATVKSLPAGIYIINGKKMVIK